MPARLHWAARLERCCTARALCCCADGGSAVPPRRRGERAAGARRYAGYKLFNLAKSYNKNLGAADVQMMASRRAARAAPLPGGARLRALNTLRCCDRHRTAGTQLAPAAALPACCRGQDAGKDGACLHVEPSDARGDAQPHCMLASGRPLRGAQRAAGGAVHPAVQRGGRRALGGRGGAGEGPQHARGQPARLLRGAPAPPPGSASMRAVMRAVMWAQSASGIEHALAPARCGASASRRCCPDLLQGCGAQRWPGHASALHAAMACTLCLRI